MMERVRIPVTPTWRGVLAAVLLPYFMVILVGLLVDWRVTFPTADSFEAALIQAINFIPGSFVLGPVALIFTVPAIGAWLLLRRVKRDYWYVCVALGGLTGFVVAQILGAGATSQSERLTAVFAIAGGLTGAVVWLVALDGKSKHTSVGE